MTNQIEPYSMIQKTNIKEHNDMINKINEIVDVINNTNLDTINAEISGLKAKATATDTEIANIKDKDTTQDTEINGITKNLVSNVTATFDNPSRELRISLGREVSPSIDATVVIPTGSESGQYSAGNGITIENYQIAVDTNVVALKTDIPIVPDVTNLTQRVTTLETEMPTKVNIAQGVENAGKVLGIGSDGNVTPVNIPSVQKEIGGIIRIPFLESQSLTQSSSATANLIAYSARVIEGKPEIIYKTPYAYNTVTNTSFRYVSINISFFDSNAVISELNKIGLNELPNGSYSAKFKPIIYRANVQPAYFDANTIDSFVISFNVTDNVISNITSSGVPKVIDTATSTDYFNGVLDYINTV